MFLVIKNKYVGIISIITLSAISLFGIHLPMSIFYYPMAIVFYLIGALIGYHFFDFISGKSSKPTQILSLLFLIIYISAKNIIPQEVHINNYLTQTITYTLAAFSLWNITDMFIERIQPKAFHRRSFAIYAMHLPIAIVMLKILSLFMEGEWLAIPRFFAMIALTLTIINLICIFLEKFAPKIYAILMGNRIRPKP